MRAGVARFFICFFKADVQVFCASAFVVFPFPALLNFYFTVFCKLCESILQTTGWNANVWLEDIFLIPDMLESQTNTDNKKELLP